MPALHLPRTSMACQVVPLEKHHIAGFHAVLDGVARERRWLAFLQAPPPARLRRFVLDNQRLGAVHCVALDNEQVVGWCDVIPKPFATQRHSGTLGMGIAATHRGRGIGTALLGATLAAAFARDLERIELIVRADNAAAIGLYRRAGFLQEGQLRRYLIVDGVAFDALQMARLATDPDRAVEIVQSREEGEDA
jgi:ribosomal protein S18 acetylase RimI-like enzyme